MIEKALIIDHGYHYKQIKHCAYLWRKFNIGVVVPKGQEEQVNCRNIEHLHSLPSKGFSVFLSLYIFMLSFRYNKFIFLTGPEYGSGILANVNKFLFYLFCFIFNKSIVIYVKNTSSYQNSCFLTKSLSYVTALLFESEYQKKYFKDNVKCDIDKCKVAYVYYPDYDEMTKFVSDKIQPIDSGKILVGLIGQFDLERRDYQPLFDLLKNQDCSNYEFYQIGRVASNSSHHKKDTSENIKFIKDEYTSDELDYLISQMDILLSMNSKEANYDNGKGTAAFSEALSAKKPLIVPKFLEVYTEYVNHVYYYEDDQTLLRSLELAGESKFIIDYDSFSTSSLDLSEIF